jgi:AraC-like DNA-binding protein
MIPSQSSTDDPLSSVLTALGARSTGLTRLRAGGDWALSFPEKHRLKLVAVIRGHAWIRLPRRTARRVVEGQVLLIGSTPYAIASDAHTAPVDGISRYAGQDSLCLGDGRQAELIGAGIVFEGDDGRFLLDALPQFMTIQSASPSALAVRRVLELLDGEAGGQRMGGARIASCLSEVLVVEAMRAYVHTHAAAHTSWIGALGDRHIGAALTLMHGDVSHAWTVAELASRVGMSRSAFSSRFAEKVGQAPLQYLTQWRMLVARRLLADTDLEMVRVAEQVGYRSTSAFGHAFKRMFGAAPKRLVRPR